MTEKERTRTKERIQADAKAYIDKVITHNKNRGMGDVSPEEYSRAVEHAAKTAYRVVQPEESE